MKRPTAESERRLDELRERARVGQTILPVHEKDRQERLSYHDLPLLKPPVWTWEIPTYFFVGGAAGASSMIAFAAQVTGTNARLVRDARRIAAIGAMLSGPLLIADLGRPERFLNMLRVFKVRSPMSVGAWTVAVWSTATTVAALASRGKATAEGGGILAMAANGAGTLAAATGLVMCTYTGVLLGVTAIPLWSQNAQLLPVHFGASSLGSAVALLELRGHDDAALNALAIGAAIFETVAGSANPTERRHPAGRSAAFEAAGTMPAERAAGSRRSVFELADVLSGPIPLALRVLGGGKRARQAAAVSTLLGSLLTRFAWVEAGKASARAVTGA